MIRAITLGLLLTAALPAQELSTIERAADALVESFVPATDDPHATIERVLKVAEEVRATQIGASMMASLDSKLNGPYDPERLRKVLAAVKTDSASGEYVHELRILQRRIQLAQARFDDLLKSPVFKGYANHATVIGPFGDGGDHYVGVPFAPEKEFPAPGVALDGRYGEVASRRSSRRWDRFRILLPDPTQGHRGCFYVLHQVEAEQLTKGYLRVYVTGSHEVWFNGRKVLTVDTADDHDTPPRFIPVVIPKGHNHVLIKTCENRVDWIGLRYVDERGAPLKTLREFEGAPKIRPHVTIAPEIAPPEPWVHGSHLLAQAARHQKGDRRARLLLAAAAVTLNGRRALELADEVLQLKPQDPRLRLALARLLQRVGYLPTAWRRQRARALIDSIGSALPDHHTLLLTRLGYLADEDKREDAVRLLRKHLDTGKGGPECFARLSSLYQGLGFWARYRRLETEWMQMVPYDLRPYSSSISFKTSSKDYAGALRLAKIALTKQPGHRGALNTVVTRAAEIGDADLARAALKKLYPGRPKDAMEWLLAEAALARRLGDHDQHLALRERIGNHPLASRNAMRTAAETLMGADRHAAAAKILQRVLAADPSEHRLRRLRNRLAGKPDLAHLDRFTIDTAPILKAFAPTPRERTATSTLVLDHMVVEVFADGSYVRQVHTLRRINDQQGVEQHEEAKDAAHADEVVLLRTIGVDGKSYVPNRVNDSFHMPRVAPGAFLESIHREFHVADAPDPQRITSFYFQSQSEPFVRSELTLILPKGAATKVRARRLPNKPVVTELDDGKVAYTYRVDDAPRIPTEFARPPIEDFIAVLSVGTDGTMQPEARRYRRSAISGTYATPPIRRQVGKLIAGMDSDMAKIKAVLGFVNTEITHGRGSSNPSTVLLERKGPPYWLQLAMLDAAGIEFRHGLCAAARAEAREGATPFWTDETPYRVPCVRVRPKDGAPFWLFAGAPPHYPLGMIPAARLGAEVLLVDPVEETKLPGGNLRDGLGVAGTGTLTLGQNGEGTLQVDVRVRGEMGFGLGDMIRRQPADRQKLFARNVVGGMLPGWQPTRDIALKQQRAGEPLTIRATLRRRNVLEVAGDEYLLPLPIGRTRFLATWGGRGARTLPMRVTAENAVVWDITVDPGKAYEITSTPEPVQARQDLIEYDLSFKKTDGGKVKIVRDFLQRAGTVSAAGFAKWRSYLGKLDEAETSNLRLKKKQ